jgi:hypothetical protein
MEPKEKGVLFRLKQVTALVLTVAAFVITFGLTKWFVSEVVFEKSEKPSRPIDGTMYTLGEDGVYYPEKNAIFREGTHQIYVAPSGNVYRLPY